MLAPAVLVLTDLSEASKDSLKWAAQIAAQHSVNLKVIYPYRLTHLNGRDDLFQIKKNIESEAQDTFIKLAQSVFGDIPTPYDFKAEVGFMNDRLYSHTRKGDVMIVVISRKMAITNKEALDELLSNLRTPLLIVPPTELLQEQAA